MGFQYKDDAGGWRLSFDGKPYGSELTTRTIMKIKWRPEVVQEVQDHLDYLEGQD